MIDLTSLPRTETTGEFAADSDLCWARQTASTVKDGWHKGAAPSVAAAFQDHPQLKNHRTVVLELAYEEYRLRLKAGESLTPDEFVRQYPSFEQSLHCFIALRSLVDKDPEFAALRDMVPWPEPGSRFLGFDLISELGRGAIGRVFLAAETALGERRIVLKVALQGGHEANILGPLRHANIVPVHSIQEEPTTGLTGFCMPYLGQATLAAVFDGVFAAHRSPIHASSILEAVQAANRGADIPEAAPSDRILRRGSYVDGVIHLGMQLAEGLAHAHANGVFHRDLKPSNILMSPEGRPLLLDFNLSVNEDHPVWRVGGTLPYMAPEELAALSDTSDGRLRRYDPRSDLFSLGVVLYEMLTGELPFGAIPGNCSVEDIAAQVQRRQAAGPCSIRRRNRHVGGRLARLIERCLAVDPDCRPPTADILAAELRKELAPARRLGRWATAHRRMVLVATLVAMLLALGTGAFFILRPPFGVRQFRQGLAYYEAGRDDLAMDCLNASLRVDPHSSEALTTRARVYQHRGDFNLAFADYDAAGRLESSPSIDASKGYCLSRLGQHKEAAKCYRRLLEAGYDSPAVLNNLGYCWFQLHRYDAAENCLRRAVQADEGLQIAHHNLVLVFLQRAVKGNAIPREAFLHARRALEIGPESGELCRDLAFLYILGAKQDAALERTAMACVAKAIAHGIDPASFESDPAFTILEKDPDFHEALAVRGGIREPLRAAYLIVPTVESR